MAAWNGEKVEPLALLKSFLGKFSSKPAQMWREMKELGKEDPKKAAHPFKVSLALTIVSLFYYFQPLYDYFGDNATWAIITVVVVFEFSVGATLGKGLNRMISTTVAGAVGLAAYGIAHRSGKTAEPFLLGFFVFIIAGLVTFLRFFPGMKARYDYGLVVFNLTFCLVSVSGYRETEVVKMAFQRVLTVILGNLTAMVICLCIFPAWSGHELHDSIASNMEKLGDFLEGFAAEYFKEQENGQRKKDYEASLTAYRRVLNSKDNEETMANLARWEPRHGRFEFRHPWKQYLKIGTLIRDCAYRIESLSIFLDFQNQNRLSVGSRVREPFTRISSESGRFLKELGSAIRDMTRPQLVDHRIASLKAASDDLKSFLASACLWEDVNLFKICPVTAMSLVLIDTVICLENISDAVDELASLANFKGVSEPAAAKIPTPRTLQPVLHRGTVQPFPANDEHHGHIVKLTEIDTGASKV